MRARTTTDHDGPIGPRQGAAGAGAGVVHPRVKEGDLVNHHALLEGGGLEMQARRQETPDGVEFARDATGVWLPACRADAKEPDVGGSR